MTYQCHGCMRNFMPELLCVHFDKYGKHTCKECCAKLHQVKKEIDK